ncbi:aminoglycoside phosphotransferase family protein [Salininema proteolyticum]|uniref:Aminoglycoside phosphotransferase family protein n=1 Tax=Salininema proteolyticum TaxID=1607685 RepID=A0ABV8U2R3_9ACTN
MDDVLRLIPSDLPVIANLRRNTSAHAWLARLPNLISHAAHRFNLHFLEPFHKGSCSWVGRARRSDGTTVVVKIGWPHPEMLTEPEALRLWSGGPAVEVIDEDWPNNILVLEDVRPGNSLADHDDPVEALRAGLKVLGGLWAAEVPDSTSVEGLPLVAMNQAAGAEKHLPRAPGDFDRDLLLEGLESLRTLSGDAESSVLLHGDFNPGNVLRHGAQDWVAIDPKPLLGDPAYDLGPLWTQVSDDPDDLPGLLEIAAETTGLDARRIAGWALARHAESVLTCLGEGDEDGAREWMADAEAVRGVLRGLDAA